MTARRTDDPSNTEENQIFTIVIKDDLIARTNSAIIDSVFYLRTDQEAFPCEGWTDFSYPLLNMWCEALLRMPARDSARCELPFMDGPFWLEVEKQGERLAVYGKTSRKTPCYFSFHCEQEAFFAEILRAYRCLVQYTFQNNQVSPGLQVEIKQGYQHYKSLIGISPKH